MYVCMYVCTVCADGEWDFDNYSIVVLGQRKELPVTCLAAVNYNVWCGTGNYVHVVGGSSLKMEASAAETADSGELKGADKLYYVIYSVAGATACD